MVKVITVLFLIGIAFVAGALVLGRQHGRVTTVSEIYRESARELTNPWRGFYRIYGFKAVDDETDYAQDFLHRTGGGADISLMEIQIYLGRYRNGAISDAGLSNIAEIFRALRLLDKQYIVRFLYDWDGKALENEPENIEIILTHMQQLEDILRENADIIFLHQGIFVGNCGEMNGSKYLSGEDMQTLMVQLARVTDSSTYLAVRTPAQWRQLTRVTEPLEVETEGNIPVSRLGLYNDGIMGTEQDYGTYGILSKEEAGPYLPWNRQEELEFQQKLSTLTPNGGEVIVENPVNDFENAVASLRTMGITYLNRAYDAAVLNKWAAATVTEEGCYDGMNGLDYVERHLGYRFFLENVKMDYDIWSDSVQLDFSLKNSGFAPMYREAEMYLVLRNTEEHFATVYQLEEDISVLTGGNQSKVSLDISRQLQLSGWKPGEYTVYFYMEEPVSGWRIQLANEQEQSEDGYVLGTIEIEELLP